MNRVWKHLVVAGLVAGFVLVGSTALAKGPKGYGGPHGHGHGYGHGYRHDPGHGGFAYKPFPGHPTIVKPYPGHPTVVIPDRRRCYRRPPVVVLPPGPPHMYRFHYRSPYGAWRSPAGQIAGGILGIVEGAHRAKRGHH